jgi:hypothetical protein
MVEIQQISCVDESTVLPLRIRWLRGRLVGWHILTSRPIILGLLINR